MGLLGYGRTELKFGMFELERSANEARRSEKLASIGEVTPEEKKRTNDLGQLASLLSKFHKGELDSEGLWRELKV